MAGRSSNRRRRKAAGPARGKHEGGGPDSRVRAWLANPERTHRLALALVLLGGVALRFVGIGDHSLWLDETLTLRDSANLREAAFQSFHPPLHYLLVFGWGEVFGRSAASLRALSAIFGVLSILLTYAVTRRLVSAPGVALLAALFVAVMPEPLWYSREMRMYALWTFFVLLGFWGLLRLGPGRDWHSAAIYWAACAGGALTHHYMVFYVAALALAAYVLVGRHPWRKKPSELGWWATLHAPVLLAGGLLLVNLAIQREISLRRLIDFLIDKVDATTGMSVTASLYHLLFFVNWAYRAAPAPAVELLVTATLAVALALLLRDTRIDARRRVAFALVALLPFLMIAALPVRNYTRLLSPTAPLIGILIAHLCWNPMRWGRHRALTVIAAAASLALLFPFVRDVYTLEVEPWNEVCAHIREHETDNSIVFVTAHYMRRPLSACYDGDNPVVGYPDTENGIGLEEVARQSAGRDQAWLIFSHAWRKRSADVEGVGFETLARRFKMVEQLDPSHLIRVFRFEQESSAGATEARVPAGPEEPSHQAQRTVTAP